MRWSERLTGGKTKATGFVASLLVFTVTFGRGLWLPRAGLTNR